MTEVWTVTCRWLGAGGRGLLTRVIELDYLPEMLGQLTHPDVEAGAPMQITSMSVPEVTARTVKIGLGPPLKWHQP